MNESQTLVQVKALKKYFPVTQGIIFQREIGTIKAVDDVSFEIKKGCVNLFIILGSFTLFCFL